MEIQLLESVGKIAGLGGLSLGVFLLLFKKIRLPKATRKHLTLFMWLVWSVAIIGLTCFTISQIILDKSESIVIVSEPIDSEKEEWLEDRNNRRITFAILKLLTPYRLINQIVAGNNYSETVIDQYTEKSFLDVLATLDLRASPDINGVHLSSVFDIQGRSAYTVGKWYQIIEKNTLDAIDEFDSIIRINEEHMNKDLIALIDKIRDHPFLGPMSCLDLQEKRGEDLSVVVFDFRYFIREVKELDQKIQFSQLVEKGNF